jgi:signal peptidase
VTHRVVATSVNLRGERVFRTQGDSNRIADSKPVRRVQIKGKLWYSVPYLGYANKYITGKDRRVTLIVVVSLLLLYAAFMFTPAGLGRPRDDRARTDSP